MTTLPSLEMRIDNARSTVRLFGLTQPITTNALAKNISFVQWDGVTGIGRIYYNDRYDLPEQFTDPSPYQTYINQWIAGAAASTPALTLAQAQAVKVCLVNSIFGVKRQQPVTVTVTAGTYSWDASDLAMTRMSALSGLLYVDPVNTLIATLNSDMATFISSLNSDMATFISSLNSDMATLISSLNSDESSFITSLNTAFSNLISTLNSEMASLISTLNANVSDTNGLETDFSNFTINLQNDLNAWVSSLNTKEGGITNWQVMGNMTVPGPGAMTSLGNTSFAALNSPTLSFPTLSFPTLSFPSLTFPTIPSLPAPSILLVPYGGTTEVSLSPTDLKAIMAAIAAQNAQEQLANNTKQAAINALTSISSVISYDATTGW